MPPRTKAKAGTAAGKKAPTGKAARPSEEDDASLPPLDVQYEPEIIQGLLNDLEAQMLVKCMQIQKDADFMVTSIQQAFHLELIKLPTQVKQMPLSRFQEEYGDSLEAVTRGLLVNRPYAGKAPTSSSSSSSTSLSSSSAHPVGTASKPTRAAATAAKGVFATPAGGKVGGGTKLLPPTGTAMRQPREGEKILSANGSPLGDFQTVVKAPKSTGPLIVPPTPSVIVPLDRYVRARSAKTPAPCASRLLLPPCARSGDVLDMDAVDVSTLSQDKKDDALAKMQAMMAAMQTAMQRIQAAK